MLQSKGASTAVRTQGSTAPRPRLFAQIVNSETDIKQAQKLRYDTFCEEYNVTIPTNHYWNGYPIDADSIDERCIHIVVRDGQTLETIGYTRVLTSEIAKDIGHFYSAHEFDIEDILRHTQGKAIEVGRTCIHPDYRNGGTIAVLWSYLARFMQENGYRYLFGCASISLADGGATYNSIMPQLREHFFSDDHLRVEPKLPLTTQCDSHRTDLTAAFPPLLKAYTKMGVRVCGEACWDPEFNVADVFVLLDLHKMTNRYARRFLKVVDKD